MWRAGQSIVRIQLDRTLGPTTWIGKFYVSGDVTPERDPFGVWARSADPKGVTSDQNQTVAQDQNPMTEGQTVAQDLRSVPSVPGSGRVGSKKRASLVLRLLPPFQEMSSQKVTLFTGCLVLRLVKKRSSPSRVRIFRAANTTKPQRSTVQLANRSKHLGLRSERKLSSSKAEY